MGPRTWTGLGGICCPAIADLCARRTAALGGPLWPCAPWGQAHDVDHSGRHRSCPTCHRLDTEAWLEERRQALLPVPYCHVIFTVPHELGEIIRQHHGTSLITYFYQKAKELQPYVAIAEDDYRYVGPRPRTKVAAIVMLADSVEAASRTLEDPSPQRIQALTGRQRQ